MEKIQNRGDNSRIMFLEYLRVFAFIAVFLDHKFHAGQSIEITSSNTLLQAGETIYNSLMALLWNGQAGVVIFFLISGYIIAARSMVESTSTFAIKRIFRIYPLFVLCMLVDLFISHYFNPDQPLPSVADLAVHATLFGDFFGTNLSVGGVEWTLRIEIVFYVFAGVLAFAGAHRSKFALSAVLLVATVGAIVGPRFPSWSPNTFGYFNQFFPFLMVGMAAYFFEAKRLPIAVLIAVAIMALGMQKFWSMFTLMVGAFCIMWSASRHITYNRFFAAVASITYSFYLIHDWMYDIVMFEMSRVTDSTVLKAIVSTLVVVALSICATRFIEKPFIKLGNRLCRWKANSPKLRTSP